MWSVLLETPMWGCTGLCDVHILLETPVCVVTCLCDVHVLLETRVFPSLRIHSGMCLKWSLRHHILGLTLFHYLKVIIHCFYPVCSLYVKHFP